MRDNGTVPSTNLFGAGSDVRRQEAANQYDFLRGKNAWLCREPDAALQESTAVCIDSSAVPYCLTG